MVGSKHVNWFNFTTVSCTAADPEVWIILVTSRNSSIQVMLDPEDGPDLGDDWLIPMCGQLVLSKIEIKLQGESKDQSRHVFKEPNILRKTLL